MINLMKLTRALLILTTMTLLADPKDAEKTSHRFYHYAQCTKKTILAATQLAGTGLCAVALYNCFKDRAKDYDEIPRAIITTIAAITLPVFLTRTFKLSKSAIKSFKRCFTTVSISEADTELHENTTSALDSTGKQDTSEVFKNARE